MSKNCSHPSYFATSTERDGKVYTQHQCKECFAVLWEQLFYALKTSPNIFGIMDKSIPLPIFSTTKMDLTKYEDDIKSTVDAWDEEWCAAIYLQLYRNGMRVNKAEGIVEKMRKKKD